MCINVNKISIIFDFLLHFTTYFTLSWPFLSFKMLPETLREDTCFVVNTLCSISLVCGRKVSVITQSQFEIYINIDNERAGWTLIVSHLKSFNDLKKKIEAEWQFSWVYSHVLDKTLCCSSIPIVSIKHLISNTRFKSMQNEQSEYLTS